MRGILLFAVLTVKSSYSREIETALENADDVSDTLQWWFGNGGSWRIRTYALDHDIHAYQVANPLQTSLSLQMEMRRLSKQHVEATAAFPTRKLLGRAEESSKIAAANSGGIYF